MKEKDINYLIFGGLIAVIIFLLPASETKNIQKSNDEKMKVKVDRDHRRD